MASHSGVSIASLAQNKESKPAFFRMLPQEIRDSIYDYAFGTELETSRLIWTNEWREREMKKRHSSKNHMYRRMVGFDYETDESHLYQIRPFPGNPLRPMIVSKQFFNEAASAWFRNATLAFDSTRTMDDFIQKANHTPLSGIKTISVTWCGRSIGERCFSPNLKWCTGLRNLCVIADDGFENVKHKTDFVEDLEPSDFTTVPLIRDISAVGSIANLEIRPGTHRHAETVRERQQYGKNLSVMCDFAMAQLKSTGEQTQRPERYCEAHKAYDAGLRESVQTNKRQAWSYAILGVDRQPDPIRYKPRDEREVDPKESPVNEDSPSANTRTERHGTSTDSACEAAESFSCLLRSGMALKKGCNHPQVAELGDSTLERESSRNIPQDLESGATTTASPVAGSRRPTITTLGVGGLLLANTICSVLALYLAARR